MKKKLMRNRCRILFVIVLSFIGLSVELQGQKIEYIKIPDLEKILGSADNKLYVLNFWATWCAPCVSEMPGFEKVSKDYSHEKVKFILVSLDFPSQIQQQLIPFLKKNNITLDVAVMTDLDYNKWIDKVDSQWQGDIPATLFFNNSRKTRFFHSGELGEPELRKYINSFL
jgi:thiol-disulfide isomerase/thioredoxin